MFNMAILICTAIAFVICVHTDLQTRTIPNTCCFAILVLGFLSCAIIRDSFISTSIIALALLFALGTLAHFDLLGGGDVKLIAAASTLVAPSSVLTLLAAIAIAGGALSLIYLSLRAWVHAGDLITTGSRSTIFHREIHQAATGGPLPYAVAIAVGSLFQLTRELPSCAFAFSC